MYQPFHAGSNLDEGTVVGDDNDLAFDLVADLHILIQRIPWMRGELFQAEGDTLLVIIEIENDDLDLLIKLNDLFRMVDTSPAKVGDMDQAIDVTEIPYMVNKAKLVEHIAELVREKKVEGISDLRDESSREGMRIVIELKRDEEPQIILNHLYKQTQMQCSFGINMLAIVAGRPKVLTLKDAIAHFVDHRREIVTRRTIFELKKAEARARQAGKPEAITSRIVAGMLEKYKNQTVLLRQEYIRDDNLTVDELLSQAIAAVHENIVIRRIVRWEAGEENDRGYSQMKR